MTKQNSPSILLTGATGSVGSEIAKILAFKGVPFRALVRSLNNTAELSSLPGVELVVADLRDRESLDRALKGIHRAFLLTNSSEEAEALQSNFVDAAVANRVNHIVKLSQFAADLNSPVRFLRYHAAVEKKIRDAGLLYTFLRPNLYMQGFLGFRELIATRSLFYASAGQAKVSAVDIRDIAAVAVEALTGSGHEDRTYDITGPEALTHDQMAECFSTALGRRIEFIDVPPQQMRAALLQFGFPEWQADGLLEDYAHYSRQEASLVNGCVEEITGKKARSFEEFTKDYAPVFLALPKAGGKH